MRPYVWLRLKALQDTSCDHKWLAWKGLGQYQRMFSSQFVLSCSVSIRNQPRRFDENRWACGYSGSARVLLDLWTNGSNARCRKSNMTKSKKENVTRWRSGQAESFTYVPKEQLALREHLRKVKRIVNKLLIWSCSSNTICIVTAYPSLTLSSYRGIPDLVSVAGLDKMTKRGRMIFNIIAPPKIAFRFGPRLCLEIRGSWDNMWTFILFHFSFSFFSSSAFIYIPPQRIKCYAYTQ